MKTYKITFIFIFFILTRIAFGQNEAPKYILSGAHFFNSNQLGLAVRYDKGIDSISFPIDTTLLKYSIKTLDINGKKISPKKVYYAYYFTPLKDTIYRLPEGKIWSNNQSFEMIFNDSIFIKKPKQTKKISKADALKLEKEKEIIRKEERELAEKRKLEREIDSRISNNVKTQTVLLWSDKNIYKVGDDLRIVIESNYDLDDIDILPIFNNNSDKILQPTSTQYSTIYNNGIERHYKMIIYKAKSRGYIILDELKLKGGLKTSPWSFQIID